VRRRISEIAGVISQAYRYFSIRSLFENSFGTDGLMPAIRIDLHVQFSNVMVGWMFCIRSVTHVETL